MKLLYKWKQICDNHNKNIDYVNYDNYWDYTELPCKVVILSLFFLLCIVVKYL